MARLHVRRVGGAGTHALGHGCADGAGAGATTGRRDADGGKAVRRVEARCGRRRREWRHLGGVREARQRGRDRLRRNQRARRKAETAKAHCTRCRRPRHQDASRSGGLSEHLDSIGLPAATVIRARLTEGRIRSPAQMVCISRRRRRRRVRRRRRRRRRRCRRRGRGRERIAAWP